MTAFVENIKPRLKGLKIRHTFLPYKDDDGNEHPLIVNGGHYFNKAPTGAKKERFAFDREFQQRFI